MRHIWQLQEAKNKLSEVVDQAVQSGPQVITRHGVETVVVISVTDYRAMITRKQRLVDFFRESPLAGVELNLARDKSGWRPGIDL